MIPAMGIGPNIHFNGAELQYHTLPMDGCGTVSDRKQPFSIFLFQYNPFKF